MAFLLLFVNCAVMVEEDTPEMLVHSLDDRKWTFVTFVVISVLF
jgi:hypothetical protein